MFLGLRFYSSSSITGAVTIGLRGRPGTRRIKTLVFFGINAASSRYSVITKQKAYVKL